MSQPKRVRIFQIFYDAETRAALDPAFEPLDNESPEHPDWSEYGPIRRVLGAASFADDEYLGFFSPRFRAKTGLTGASVLATVAARDAEIFSFSPYFEQAALHQSPFDQGERMHPGLMKAMVGLLPILGIAVDPRTVICDHTTTIFANFFVARYSLWRDWFALAERLFAFCQAREHPLALELVAATQHRDVQEHPMKVFVMERLITLFLEARGLRAHYAVDIKTAPRSIHHVSEVLGHLVVLDALKGQFRTTGNAMFLEQYRLIQRQVFGLLDKLRAQAATEANRKNRA